MSHYPFYDVPTLDNVKDLVDYCAEKYGSKPAFKGKNGKTVYEYSFQNLQQDTIAFQTFLQQLGVQGKHIAVIGPTSYEWIVTYLGCVNGGNVIIPIDKELPLSGICDLLERSETACLVFHKQLQPHIEEIARQLPGVRHFIALHQSEDSGATLSFWQHVKALHAAKTIVQPKLDPDKMAAILFTSGTTGKSKGVMLTHKNLISSVLSGAAAVKLGHNEIALSILPVHHTFEFGVGILCFMLYGVTICINDSLKNFAKNFRLFQPTLLVAVPLVVETLYKQIWFEAERTGKAGRLSFAIKLSQLLLKFGIDLRSTLFADLRAAFGGKLHTIIYGGAYSPPEIVGKFSAFGIKLIQGYGITECSPLVAANTDPQFKAASVGMILPSCQVIIDHPAENGEGEILVKGNNVMLGYYNDAAATADAFSDGWFRTGDLGHLDSDHFLYITGRKKNLIILKNGKNICPEEIEGYFQEIPYIKELVVFAKESQTGDELSLLAEIYPDQDTLATMTEKAFRQQLTADMEKINRQLPLYKQVNDFILRDKEFEKTTTKKIKRFAITRD